jgi:hypothetical protein
VFQVGLQRVLSVSLNGSLGLLKNTEDEIRNAGGGVGQIVGGLVALNVNPSAGVAGGSHSSGGVVVDVDFAQEGERVVVLMVKRASVKV